VKTHTHLPAVFILLFLLAPAAWAQSFTLGTTNLLEGPAAGSDSVVLAANISWSATANAAWLHLTTDNQGGSGSTNVIFTFDANLGATRTGTLTIAGQTLTITQAGSNYVSTAFVNTLVSSNATTPLNVPLGVAVDGPGNIYIAGGLSIKKWTAANSNLTTLGSPGLNYPTRVAVDGAGNVYIADTGLLTNISIKKWTVANSNITTLVSGESGGYGVAVDSSGNVYFTGGNNGIRMWTAANSNVTTLVSSGLNIFQGVAVDGAGNVYIADSQNSVIKKWTAANSNVTTLVSGISSDGGLAVDGSGNVYISSWSLNTIKKWTAASNTVTTPVSSGYNYLNGAAPDGLGNLYIASRSSFSGGSTNNAIMVLPHAFVDSTTKMEKAAAGNDTLSVVLPATTSLTGSSAPFCDASWLTITGCENGVVSFAYTANNFLPRTAHITVLGQNIIVNQAGPPNYAFLGTTNLLEGPIAGSDSVVLMATGAWSATANVSWLHLSADNQSGPTSTNVIFSFDANAGATRIGTMTIAGQSVTITQAGSTYAPVTNATTLVSSGLSNPYGVAVDGAGNVYIADVQNSAIKKWIEASNIVTTLVSSGLIYPRGVAVDGTGNVYIADTLHNAIKEWNVANSNVTTLVLSNATTPLSSPRGVAVDYSGNIYIADEYNNAIKKLTAANNTVNTLVSSNAITSLNQPWGVAVDGTGNVFIADSGNNAIKEWTAANSNVTTLVSSNATTSFNYPIDVTVDGSGNVYFPNGNIKKWTAASQTVTTLLSSSLFSASGVAVDGAGNVFIAENWKNTIKELPNAFVDSTTKTEPVTGSSDTLPVVLPTTANLTGPFTPTSDSAWLTVTGCTNGVVSFAFTTNYFNTYRTAHITLLGQSITVIQTTTIQHFLTGCKIMGNGNLQLAFTNNQGASFTVWTSTNMLLPFTNWTPLGALTNDGSGQYQFTDPSVTNGGQRFYRVSSP